MAQLRLKEDAARDVLLVRAIENEDPSAAVFTREDRQFADSSALRSVSLGEDDDPRRTAAFVATRARLALERLVARYPLLQRARLASGWPAWMSFALPGAALLFGLLSNRLEGDRFNILAFPLLGMLAWNLMVYVLLLVRAGRSAVGQRPAQRELSGWLGKLVSPAAARLAGHPTLEKGVARFARDWASAAAPLTRSRVRRTLHLSAALLALGIIIGMFVRARYTAEYTAGWAGTWAGAEQEVATVLSVVLGPASALTGIALPTAERLSELRGAAENAGDWLILWIVTATILVIIPRLCLAAFEASRSGVLRRRVPVAQDFYLRSLMRNALGRASSVRVVPYGFDSAGSAEKSLIELLRQALGDKTDVRVDPPVRYGDEDEWVAGQERSLGTADHVILLFSLGSTPEAENHGVFAESVQARLGDEAELTVLLDESSFAHKLRGHPSAERRLADRYDAWTAVLAKTGLKPIRVKLEPEHQAEAARELEKALLRSPVRA